MTNRQRYDIDVYKRDTWDGITITMTTSTDGGVTSTPMDLNNTTITMQIKINATDDSPVLQLSTTDNTVTITDATNGVFKINPINISLDAGMYYYDIQFNFAASNKIKTYMFGTFNVTQDVTQIV